jgi:hypothetical protein
VEQTIGLIFSLQQEPLRSLILLLHLLSILWLLVVVLVVETLLVEVVLVD